MTKQSKASNSVKQVAFDEGDLNTECDGREESGDHGIMDSVETRQQCRELREAQGLEFQQIEEITGVPCGTVSTWAKRENWGVPRVIKHIISKRMTVKSNTPSLQAALSALYKASYEDKEKAFDEHLHDIACAVPFIIKQMPVDEWVTKADKIAKLVQMAREVLGKGEKREARSPVSISILAANPPPVRQLQREVIELEEVTQ
jgi:hypothetical protein